MIDTETAQTHSKHYFALFTGTNSSFLLSQIYESNVFNVRAYSAIWGALYFVFPVLQALASSNTLKAGVSLTPDFISSIIAYVSAFVNL